MDERSAGTPHPIERACRNRYPCLEARAFDVSLEARQAVSAHASSEPAGGGFLEPVSLVEDDRVVLGQDRRVRLLAQSEICEVEGVVDDDEIGFSCLPPRGFREACADEPAPPPEASIRADRELRPERLRRLELELGTRTSRPRAAAASGTSFVRSCSWSAFVAVDDDAALRRESRDEVRQALTGPRAGLGEQVLTGAERVGNRLR